MLLAKQLSRPTSRAVLVGLLGVAGCQFHDGTTASGTGAVGGHLGSGSGGSGGLFGSAGTGTNGSAGRGGGTGVAGRYGGAAGGGVAGPGCADALIALDRSCSMVDKPNGFTSSKYAVAEQVLKALTVDYDTKMAFGFNAFPPLPGEGTKCDAGRIYVDIDFGTSAKIASAIATIDPTIPANKNCGTPTGANAEMLGGYAPLLAPGRKHNIILLTDGMPVCAGETVARSVAAIDKLRMLGVQTFVVGFLVGANVSALNMMADAGGQPQQPPAASRFYNAANPDELDFTLRKILSTICSYIPPPACPTGLPACGGGGIDPAGCPMGTVCSSGCCLNFVP